MALVSRLPSGQRWFGPRTLALLSVAVALGAPLRTMYHLIDVVGSPARFLAVAVVSLLAAAALARVLGPRLAVGLGAALLGVGAGWYFLNLTAKLSASVVLSDTAKLLTGTSLLQISNVRLWVTSFVSPPVFLTAYFALRRWYVSAVLVSGGTLAFFVLTTDAGVVTTLLGVVGGVAAVGFGSLDAVTAGSESVGAGSVTEAGIDTGRRSVLKQLAAVAALPTLTRVLSRGEGGVAPADSGPGTIEASLVNAGDSLAVQGSISLSPARRFTVESDEPRYWRVGAYDRYTGDGWVRTGKVTPYSEYALSNPPGRRRRVEQTFDAESDIGIVPAAWKPVRYDGDPDVGLTRHEGLRPVDGLSSGDSYEDVSELLDADPAQLRVSDGDYPDEVNDRYRQLPESTPGRVGETTERVTEGAETPYEAAKRVEQWLESNREYSLDVSRPNRNVADRFLHAMNEGYCVYFATTMAVMLRTQDIPSRMAVGYTSGEKVGEDRWVVRGLHSHAWVEVYVPEQGWVQFDPTPSGPREAAERRSLEGAGDGERATETPAEGQPTSSGARTPEETPTPGSTATPRATERSTTANGTNSDTEGGLPLRARETVALGVLALVGVGAGLRRADVAERAVRAVWVRYQRPEHPERDIERAFQRVMYVLSVRYRQRGDGETVRAYLDAIDADDDIRRLATLRERLRYDGSVSPQAAREAIDIADGVVAREPTSRSPDSV